MAVNGVITEVGPTRRVANLREAQGASVLDADGCVVAPGLVDAHTHLVEAVRRGAKSWSAARVEAEMRDRLDQILSAGTTTLCAHSSDEKDARLSASLFCAAEVVSWITAKPRDWMSSSCGLPVSFLSTGTHEDADELEQALLASWRRGVPARVHGGRQAAVAVRCGARSFDHASSCSEEDLDLLARSATTVTLVPAAEFHQSIPPVSGRGFIDAGGAVALGTDFSDSTSRSFSMTAVMAMACAMLKLSPAEAWTAATINAAHLLGVGSSVGSLEVGKQADILVFATSDYRDVCHAVGTNLVKAVVKRGRVVYRRREVEWSA